MRNIRNYKQFIILTFLFFIVFEFIGCTNTQKKNTLANYNGYALIQAYNIGHGRTNYNIFPIDIKKNKLFNEENLNIKYCLILSFSTNDSSYKEIEKELKELNYEFKDNYFLAKINYTLKNKNYSQFVEEWNDSITFKSNSYKLKVYFPQNNNEIIKINTLNILKILK